MVHVPINRRCWFDPNILHKVNPLWVATMVVGTNWLPLVEERRYPVFSLVTMDGCQSGLLSFFAKEMLSKKQPQVQILYHPPTWLVSQVVKTSLFHSENGGFNSPTSHHSALIYCRYRFVIPWMPYCIYHAIIMC